MLAYLTLARPVSRSGYYLSKWLGISVFSLVNLILLFSVLAMAVHFAGGHISGAFFQAAALIWVESTLLAALALLSSIFLRSGLTLMLVSTHFFISHNHQQLNFLKEQAKEVRSWMEVLEFLTPNSQLFLMDTHVYYEQALQGNEWVQRIGYGALWALLFLLLRNTSHFEEHCAL